MYLCKEVSDEFDSSFFGPVEVVPVARYKADMTSVAGDLQHCVRVARAFLNRVTTAFKERIIQGIYDEGWNVDLIKPLAAAAFLPIIFSAVKTVDGGRIPAVKILERFDLVIVVIVDILWKLRLLHFYFLMEQLQETPHVNNIPFFFEGA